MTYLTDHDLFLRFREARPGRKLIAIEDVALPVTVLRVLVAAQEDKDLPLLEEFLLRGVHAGLSSVDQVAGLLGLETSQLESAMVNQLAVGNLEYHPSTGKVGLTAQGTQAAMTLRAVTPVELELPASFDRTLWRATEYRDRDLITKSQARERAMRIVPASRHEHVESSHVRLPDLEHLVRVEKRGHRHLQLLAILRASVVKHRYLPAKLLLFTDEVQAIPEIAWVVDGDESPIHAREFEKLASSLTSRMRVMHDEMPRWEDAEALLGAGARTSNFEHLAPMAQQELARATLTGTDRRVSVLTSRLGAAVLDHATTAQLESNLRRGASVHIGYFDVEEAESDHDVVRRLEQLARRYASFRIAKLRQRPPHLLVSDTKVLHSKMELLSFKSHPTETYLSSNGRLFDGVDHADVVHDAIARAVEAAGD
ncbi:hypothetical protein LC082_08210 [Microbacterium esteraromaticum]|uniref:hypothetical protein n=1 Tax=Microbacterium esteraromaticum TaxID=57043 RepID=UPI001CD4D617|nr:hypothetical protein [Microbacterium esteraromaticum]MCA1306879.1 hypothetical protein [Microbacterium esteraromaticum]